MNVDPRPRRSHPWSRLLVEIASVVFAVLLALGVNEWWQEREDARLAEETTAAVLDEIRRNRETLLDGVTVAEEARVARELDDAIATFRRGGKPDGAAVNWDVALLSSAAWETARITGTIRDMPLDQVVEFAELYEMQRYFVRSQDELTSLIADIGAAMEARPLETLVRLRSRLANASALRRTLASTYACVLIRMEGPETVEEGACPDAPKSTRGSVDRG